MRTRMEGQREREEEALPFFSVFLLLFLLFLFIVVFFFLLFLAIPKTLLVHHVSTRGMFPYHEPKPNLRLRLKSRVAGSDPPSAFDDACPRNETPCQLATRVGVHAEGVRTRTCFTGARYKLSPRKLRAGAGSPLSTRRTPRRLRPRIFETASEANKLLDDVSHDDEWIKAEAMTWIPYIFCYDEKLP